MTGVGPTRAPPVIALRLVGARTASAQEPRRALCVGPLPADTVIDGHLNEAAWKAADAFDDVRQADPVAGTKASSRTRVQVLADTRALVVGITCEEADPMRIVSFSVRRNAVLTSEDHLRIVIGPFGDGRSGITSCHNPQRHCRSYIDEYSVIRRGAAAARRPRVSLRT